MCFILHKWEKWSDTKPETWTQRRIDAWGNLKSHNYTVIVQDRTCKDCGQTQIRTVRE